MAKNLSWCCFIEEIGHCGSYTCGNCPKSFYYCCFKMNNCEPWHCSLYNDYLAYKEKYSNDKE